MIRVKLIENMASQSGFCRYDSDIFLDHVLDNIFEERTEPPFRDRESLLFIQEVDEGNLVEGDWYSYVSPYGRACMSSLCGGTQYALTLIRNSRRGSYTSYYPYGEDIWQRLQSLDMDILVVYDPNYYDDGGFDCVPSEMKGCVLERVSIDGKVYENAVFDAKWGGKLHRRVRRVPL